MAEQLVGVTLDAGVREQLKVRQQIYDLGNQSGRLGTKDAAAINFQNNTSWVRLASAVDIKVPEEDQIPAERLEDYSTRVSNIAAHFGVTPGSALAKQVILTGGVAELSGSINLIPKTGFDTSDGSKFPDSSYGFGGTRYGYKPMPFVESISREDFNQGALFKLDIKIKCFSPEQLEILEVLYMRPGYTILAEWGHFNYTFHRGVSTIDGGTTSTAYVTNYSETGEVPVTALSEFFSASPSAESIREKIKQERIDKEYSYDGVLATVTNFSYTFNKDASYDVTVKAFAFGTVIESLQIGANNGQVAEDVETAEKPTSLLEAKLKALQKADSRIAITSTSNPEVHPLNGDLPEFKALLTQVDQSDIYKVSLGNPSFQGAGEGASEFTWQYYVSFGSLMRILEKNHALYTNDGTELLKYQSTGNYMFTLPYEYSSDPRVCLVNFNAILQPSTNDPNTVAALEFSFLNNIAVNTPKLNVNLEDNTLAKNGFLGDLSYVGINFDLIYRAIESNKDNAGKIPVVKFLQYILGEVKSALGGINEFQVVVDDERELVYVVDIGSHVGSSRNDIFKFVTYGIGDGNTVETSQASILTDIRFTTSLTNEYASQIAIGAQANGNQLGDTSIGLAEYNIGLIDRVRPVRGLESDSSKSKYTSQYATWAELLVKISNEIASIYTFGEGRGLAEKNINYLKSLQQQAFQWAIGYFVGTKKVIPAPNFIPFNIELELLGISGLKLFQRFTIDDRILPYMYRNKVDFLVMSINQSVSKNKWVTKIKAKAIPIQLNLSEYAIGTTRATAQPPRTTPPSGPQGDSNHKSLIKGYDVSPWWYKGPTTKTQIYLHHTAGSATATIKGTIDGWNSRYQNGIPARNIPPGEHVGAHYVVDRSGDYDLTIPLSATVGHLGTNQNPISIGIEIINTGPVESTHPNAVKSVGPDGTTPRPYRDLVYWEEFTDAQIATVKKIIKEIKQTYPNIPLTYTFEDWFPDKNALSQKALGNTPGVYTHGSVTGRKIDVGPTPKMVKLGKELAQTVTDPFIEDLLKQTEFVKRGLDKEAQNKIGAQWATVYLEEDAAYTKAIEVIRNTINQNIAPKPARDKVALRDWIKKEWPSATNPNYQYILYLFGSRDTEKQFNGTKAILNSHGLAKWAVNKGKIYVSPNSFDSQVEDIWEAYINNQFKITGSTLESDL